MMSGVSRLPARLATALLSLADPSGTLFPASPSDDGGLEDVVEFWSLPTELPLQIGVLFAQIRYLPVLLGDSPAQFLNLLSQALVFQLQLVPASLALNLRRSMSLPRCLKHPACQVLFQMARSKCKILQTFFVAAFSRAELLPKNSLRNSAERAPE
jgi:hypothetical protein